MSLDFISDAEPVQQSANSNYFPLRADIRQPDADFRCVPNSEVRTKAGYYSVLAPEADIKVMVLRFPGVPEAALRQPSKPNHLLLILFPLPARLRFWFCRGRHVA